MNLSIRQVSLQFGFNSAHIDTLTRCGVLTVVAGSTTKRPQYDPDQIRGLRLCGFPGVPRTVNNDKSKDAYLKAAGWHILRIPGHQILRDTNAAIDIVRETVHRLQQGSRA
jgi:hypothetical protein